MERVARGRRRRRDRRAQIGVVLLAALAGVGAGLLGTNRSWEGLPGRPAPTSTTTTTPASFPAP